MIESTSATSWYKEWFNSPYYHILYKHRNYQEAASFIDQLISKLAIRPNSSLLDLACGKGRHSLYLSRYVHDVVGADLSVHNINLAKKLEKPGLKFCQEDMRKPIAHNRFDYILNLFTSFGYFDAESEDLKALEAVRKALKKNGLFVIDFFNTEKTLRQLVPFSKVEVEGIQFTIERFFQDGFIIKHIHIQDNGKSFHYQERVRAITLELFQQYFDRVGMKVENVFGDYQLNPFQQHTSPRMVITARKLTD